MPESCSNSLAHLLLLHQQLLRSASDELLDAFESISDAVGRVIEADESAGSNDQLVSAIVKLQAADSVAQRLSHVENGLQLIEQRVDALADSPTNDTDDALIKQTADLFTIADERATFASVFADDHCSVADAVVADDPDLFLFDDSSKLA